MKQIWNWVVSEEKRLMQLTQEEGLVMSWLSLLMLLVLLSWVTLRLLLSRLGQMLTGKTPLAERILTRISIWIILLKANWIMVKQRVSTIKFGRQ